MEKQKKKNGSKTKTKKNKQEKNDNAPQNIQPNENLNMVTEENIALTTSAVTKYLLAQVPFVLDMTELDIYRLPKNPSLADAIKKSSSIKCLNFRASVDKVAWDDFTDALSSNQSIRTVSCDCSGPNPFRAEKMFADVLANNNRIKKFIYTFNVVNGVEYLAKIIQNGKSIEDLEFIELNDQFSDADRVAMIKIFAENTTITRFKATMRKVYQLVCLLRALKYDQGCRKLFLEFKMYDKVLSTEISILKEILQSNSTLTALTIRDYGVEHSRFVPMLAEGLKHNKSITSLHIATKIDSEEYALLGEALAVNNTLTKLDLKQSAVMLPGVADLAHGLALNSSLKSLNISSFVQFDVQRIEPLEALEEALIKNTTLTELDIRNAPPKDYEKLLRHNKTLKTLKLHVDNENYYWLMRGLAANETLTSLTVHIKKIGDFQKHLVNMTANNESLLYLELYSGWGAVVLVDLVPIQLQRLQRNRELLRQRKSNILFFFQLILRQRGFTDKLPLDLWAKIFSAVSVPGISMDLGKALYSLAQNHNKLLL